MLDFYLAREYVGKAAEAIHCHGPRRREWEDDWSHRLKHTKGPAKQLLSENEECAAHVRGKTDREELGKAITYFTNHRSKRQYWRHTEVAEFVKIETGHLRASRHGTPRGDAKL